MKERRTKKSNYRPTSVLSNFSKIYKIYSYFDESTFLKNQCCFQGFNTRLHILGMTKKMKTSCNKQFCAAILTDLSKAYGFDKKAIKLLP